MSAASQLVSIQIHPKGKVSNTPSLGKGHPEDKDELEDVVEWEPVDSVDGRLNDGQEGVDDPVLRMSVFSAVLFVPRCSKHTVSHWLSSVLLLVKRASRE